MVRIFGVLAVAAGLLVGSRLGRAGPLDGSFVKSPVVGPERVWEEKAKFRGGERACVIAWGQGKGPISLQVRDEKENVVGEDNPAGSGGKEKVAGGDICAVIWYPPRDGEYKITVRMHGAGETKCWVGFR